jgi:hypothetical protein
VRTRAGTRPAEGGGWMDDLNWLRSREKAIYRRIHNEGSTKPRMPVDVSSRRARRQALSVIQRRISELEALVDHPQTDQDAVPAGYQADLDLVRDEHHQAVVDAVPGCD